MYWDFGELGTSEVEGYLAHVILHKEATILVAVEEKQIVGFLIDEIMTCHLPISSVKKIGYITATYVIPDYRRKGIMKTLEGLAIDFFKKKDLKYVELNSLLENKLESVFSFIFQLVIPNFVRCSSLVSI